MIHVFILDLNDNPAADRKKQLHKQVHYYSERFEDFNDTLSKSNEAISDEVRQKITSMTHILCGPLIIF